MTKEISDFTDKVAELVQRDYVGKEVSLPAIDLGHNYIKLAHININNTPTLAIVGMEPEELDAEGKPTKTLAERAKEVLFAIMIPNKACLNKLISWLAIIDNELTTNVVDAMKTEDLA